MHEPRRVESCRRACQRAVGTPHRLLPNWTTLPKPTLLLLNHTSISPLSSALLQTHHVGVVGRGCPAGHHLLRSPQPPKQRRPVDAGRPGQDGLRPAAQPGLPSRQHRYGGVPWRPRRRCPRRGLGGDAGHESDAAPTRLSANSGVARSTDPTQGSGGAEYEDWLCCLLLALQLAQWRALTFLAAVQRERSGLSRVLGRPGSTKGAARAFRVCCVCQRQVFPL